MKAAIEFIKTTVLGGVVVVIPIAVIILFFFVAGLLLNTLWGRSAKFWLEKNIFERIPLYSTLSQLTQRIAGIENENFPVVEVNLYGTSNRVLGIVVDTLPDDRLVVYTPSSPVVTVGQLNIVEKENAIKLDVSITETLNSLSMMGMEAGKIYAKSK